MSWKPLQTPLFNWEIWRMGLFSLGQVSNYLATIKSTLATHKNTEDCIWTTWNTSFWLWDWDFCSIGWVNKSQANTENALATMYQHVKNTLATIYNAWYWVMLKRHFRNTNILYFKGAPFSTKNFLYIFAIYLRDNGNLGNRKC